MRAEKSELQTLQECNKRRAQPDWKLLRGTVNSVAIADLATALTRRLCGNNHRADRNTQHTTVIVALAKLPLHSRSTHLDRNKPVGASLCLLEQKFVLWKV